MKSIFIMLLFAAGPVFAQTIEQKTPASSGGGLTPITTGTVLGNASGSSAVPSAQAILPPGVTVGPTFYPAANTQAAIVAAETAACANGGGTVQLAPVAYTITATLPVCSNVIYNGAGYSGLNTATGTVLTCSANTFDAFDYNNTDLGTAPTNSTTFQAGWIRGFGVTNLTISSCNYGIKVGALYNAGGLNLVIQNVSAINNAAWGFWFENYNFAKFRSLYAGFNTLGGMWFGSSGGAVMDGGNSVTEDLGVTTSANNVSLRGIVLASRGTGSNSLNQNPVNNVSISMSNRTAVTQAATMTNASATIGVTDSTKFIVDQPVVFSATVNGFTTAKTYFVLSSAANVITVGTYMGGAALTATGTTAVNVVSYGFSPLELIGYYFSAGAGHGSIFPAAFTNLDLEAPGSSVSNSSVTLQQVRGINLGLDYVDVASTAGIVFRASAVNAITANQSFNLVTYDTDGIFTAPVINGGSLPAVDSLTAGPGLSVNSSTGAVTASLSQSTNPQTGTSYTIATTDAANLVTFSNASAVAVALPAATTTGFGAGFSLDTQNIGAGAVTITPTTSLINGASSLVMVSNTGCTITSDGTNYQTSACTANSPGNSTTPTFSTLTVTSTVSGAGFSTYLASPPAIGGTLAAAGTFKTLGFSGNISTAASLANGVGMGSSGTTLTYTDSSSAGGTITSAYMYNLPQVTFTASAATTYTNASELFLPSPSCSTNTTCTNVYSLYASGKGFFGGVLTTAGLTDTGTTAINSNTSATTTIGAGTATGQVTIGGGSNTVKIGSNLQIGATLTCSITAPTVTSGLGTSPVVTAANTCAFLITTGSGSPTTTTVLAMPTANAGYACQATDITTSLDTASETAYTTTAVTFTWNIAPSASDKIIFNCGSF